MDELGNKSSYIYYDEFNLPKSVLKSIDSNLNQETIYEITEDKKNIKSIIQKHIENGVDKSIITNYVYDEHGNVIKEETYDISDKTKSIVQNNEYDSKYNNGLLTKNYINVTDCKGQAQIIEEQYEYDFNTGNKTAYINANYNRTSYKYDNLGRLIKVINPDNTEKLYIYDDVNNIVTYTDENNHRLRKIFDGFGGFVKKEESINGNWITMEEKHYNDLEEIDWSKDGNGNITKFKYDAFDRITKTTFPDSTCITKVYNDGKNIKIEYDEEGYAHYYFYNNKGDLIKESKVIDKNDILNTCDTSYMYNNIGKQISMIDANGNGTIYKYDDLGRLVQVIDALGETVNYEYDFKNNLIKVTTAEGSITQKKYDELGRLIVEIDPLGKEEKIIYDKAGNILERSNRSGQITRYEYDNLNRMKKQTIGNLCKEYTYDAAGRTLSVNDDIEKITYEYYENGKLKSENLPDGKFIYYEYDNNGNKIKMLDYFGKITAYIYDNRNRLISVTQDNKTTTYSYYLNGSRKKINYPNGVIEEYSYNGLNNLINLINKKADETIINQFSYTYDKFGNQISKIDNNEVTRYGYDKLNRISKIIEPSGIKTIYEYDKNGNISRKAILNEVMEITDYIYDGSKCRLIETREKTQVNIDSLSISAAKSYLNSGEQITFILSGLMKDTTKISDKLLAKAKWSTSNPNFILDSTIGKSITGTMTKEAYDGMGKDDYITITVELYGVVATAKIYKNHMKYLAISSPSPKYINQGQQVILSLSGEMMDGGIIPDELLNDAKWSTGNPSFTLDSTTGKSITGTMTEEAYDNMGKDDYITITAEIDDKELSSLKKAIEYKIFNNISAKYRYEFRRE